MQRVIILFIAISFLFSTGCSHSKQERDKSNNAKNVVKSVIKKDTLAYTLLMEGGESEDCKKCDYVGVNYLVFKGDTALNNAIKEQIISYIAPYADGVIELKNFEKDLKKVTTPSKQEVDSSLSEEISLTTFDLYVRLIKQDSILIVLDFAIETSGGVHGNYGDYYMNWDTKAHKEISLDDLLIANYEHRLTNIAESIFRKNEGLAKHESLKYTYHFQDDVFSLNDNFYLTPEGLMFYYNIYEIKPYMQGTTDLLIPYAQIKSLLKPNTVITQYIK